MEATFDCQAWQLKSEAQRAERQAMRKAQVTEFCAEMRAAGITSIVCEYAGGGDSGSIEGASCYPDNSEHKNKALIDRIQNFAERWVDDEHPGWENGEGASGEITFDASLGTAVMSHDERYVETNNEVTTIGGTTV